MARPAALQAQALARLRAEQRPDDGQQVAAAAGGHAGDGIAGLLVGIGDPLEHGFQRGKRWGRGLR